MKTLAAILVEQKKPLVLDEVELPTLSYGQVLVEVKATRICGSQLGEIDGVKGPDRYLPHLLGHEAGGIVLEIGPEVTQAKPGDHVVLHWRPGLGIQARPSVYSLRGNKINAGNITTFQQHTVVSENRLTVVPASVPFETSALLADTITTGFGAVSRVGALQPGESVAVIGVGGIGLGAILGAHLAGAATLIGIDISDEKLSYAKKFGATHLVNSANSQLTEELLKKAGSPVDLIIETTGRPRVIEQAWAALSPKGRMVLIGVMPKEQHLEINTLPFHYGKRIIGTEGGESQPAMDIPRYLRLFQARGLELSGMVSHRVALTEINPAIERMRAGLSTHTIVHF